MSLLQLFTNNAISLLQVGISASSTTIQLQPGQGALFPQPTNPGEFFLVTLEDVANPNIREIVRVEGRIGDTLTNCVRGQEGTTAQSWPAIDTLVDHRITAETIRQAFLQPVAPPPVSGSGGYEYAPVTVFSMSSEPIATVNYSHTRRGNKFWVTMYCPQNEDSQTFELLTLIEGNMNTNSEHTTWSKTNRIGYNFHGNIQLSLNTLSKVMTLAWQNNEPLVDVIVTVVRI
jgi:hypothetical protein